VVDDHHAVAGARADPDGHLAAGWEPALGGHLRQAGMRHQAGGDGHEVVAVVAAEREAAVSVRHAPQGGPVAGGGQDRAERHLGGFQAAEAGEGLGHHGRLELPLGVGVDVLPAAAAAARGHELARWDHPGRGGLDHLDQRGAGVVAPLVGQRHPDPFTGQGALHEHHPARGLAGHALAADRQRGDRQQVVGARHPPTLG
jgi:hypothetical protein